MIEIPVGFVVALSCVMGNRLLLNIRDSVTSHENYDVHVHPLGSTGWQYQSGEIRLGDRDKINHQDLIALRSLHAKI